MNFPWHRKIIVGAAIISAATPLIFIFAWHARSGPDIFIPGAPARTINDFTPSDRTGAPEFIDGIRVRPILASPVYLLFVPRRQTKFIDVTVVGKPTGTIELGYRVATDVAGNRMRLVAPITRSDGWSEWTVTLLRAEMLVEDRGAVRFVVSFPHERTAQWLIREVRIAYRDE